ncbi:MAG: hypothetical protein HDS11_02765 [Bacteroides sp.]|nr:hypothetical protein [Bacteroides sp.]
MINNLSQYYQLITLPIILLVIFDFYLYVKKKHSQFDKKFERIHRLFIKLGIEGLALSVIALIVPPIVISQLSILNEAGKLLAQITIKMFLWGIWGISILLIVFYILFRVIYSVEEKDTTNPYKS